jgi:hypothetical protein
VGSETYKRIASLVFSEYTGETVLSVFLKMQSRVSEVIPWIECDLADAEGNGERMMVYDPNPLNFGLIIPLDFASQPAEARNLHYIVPNEGRIGGVVCYRPLAAVYVDALLD